MSTQPDDLRQPLYSKPVPSITTGYTVAQAYQVLTLRQLQEVFGNTGGVEIMKTFWAVEWHSVNNLDGDRRTILWEFGRPLLFDTRDQARKYIKEKYSYIANRPDLRAEPHGWKMPKTVKVEVKIEKLP